MEPLRAEQQITLDLLRVVAKAGEFRGERRPDGAVQIFRPDDAPRVLITIDSATYADVVARGALIPVTVLFTERDAAYRSFAFHLR